MQIKNSCPSSFSLPQSMDLLYCVQTIWHTGVTLVVIASTVYLILRRSSNKSIFLRSCKESKSRTPPQSGRPEQKGTPSSLLTYTHILPPSRQRSLPEVGTDGIRWREVKEETVQKNLLPMDMSYRTNPSNFYTPTAFSIEEIKRLGDFPDYAKLSGIPLPNPYPAHDIENAYPRPYRPFRWAYHQTMCKKYTHDRKKELTQSQP